MNKDSINSGDSEDLEALFDSIVKANQEDAPVAAPAPTPVVTPVAVAEEPATHVVVEEKVVNLDESQDAAQTMFSKIGQMTRNLHDTLRELGYDKALEKAASTIPDARDRLTYIANMTEQAANRALNAVDSAKPWQDRLESESQQLEARWNKLMNKELSIEEFKVLVEQTRSFLHAVPDCTKGTNDQLLEIMMAQDFQDLTGQVIKKIVTMAQELESQLFGFLLEFAPHSKPKAEIDPTLENGPVIHAEGRTDVVTDQQQVDDLLASLGF